MRIDIISAVPEILSGPLTSSIIKKSIDKGIANIFIHNLRNYSKNNYNYNKWGLWGWWLWCTNPPTIPHNDNNGSIISKNNNN